MGGWLSSDYKANLSPADLATASRCLTGLGWAELGNNTALLETTTSHFMESTAEDNQNANSRACPMRSIIDNCDINCDGASPVCTGTNQGFTFSSESTGNFFVSSKN